MAASAAGSIFSGMSQAAGYEASAQGKKYQAQGQREQGAYDSRRQDDRNKRLTGQQITAVASSGVDLWGTPLDVVADARKEGEMDKQAIRYGAQFNSNLSLYEAKVDKMNAGIAKTGGFIGAIAPLVNGFSGLKTSFG
jgi:hypothetical protein